jgi:SAM-dependent methyltransferase
MTELDPTQRFTVRADNYARYRPGYPAAVLDCLRDECGLTPRSVVADVGSGTGILTKLFLDNGNTVYAVEPNAAMRAAAEAALNGRPGFISIDGRAEATTLADGSVDLVAAGQAFHWFDAAASRTEFDRILRPGGYVALIWNARAFKDNPLMADYERVLGEFGMGHNTVRHRSHAGQMEELFVNGHETCSFTHTRPLTYEMFWGGFLSSSYAPLPGDPRYEPVQAALRQVFDAHQQGGWITFLYETEVHFGQL